MFSEKTSPLMLSVLISVDGISLKLFELISIFVKTAVSADLPAMLVPISITEPQSL